MLLGLLADPVAKALELLDVQGKQPLVVLHRQDYRYLTLLAPDADGFTLRSVQNGSQRLPGFRG
jgi:hypothetical protein